MYVLGSGLLLSLSAWCFEINLNFILLFISKFLHILAGFRDFLPLTSSDFSYLSGFRSHPWFPGLRFLFCAIIPAICCLYPGVIFSERIPRSQLKGLPWLSISQLQHKIEILIILSLFLPFPHFLSYRVLHLCASCLPQFQAPLTVMSRVVCRVLAIAFQCLVHQDSCFIFLRGCDFSSYYYQISYY